MTITWSGLHRLLGLTPEPLTRTLVERAVAESIPEASDLDWKGALPRRTDQGRDEFAKDVAAMANSGGGLLVYGVTEDGNSHANEISPVEIGENVERRLRATAASRVHPAVAGLQFVGLPDDGDQARGVVVLAVPSSGDAPHVLERDTGIWVPYRDGAETLWMRERELERAYADRFAQRINERSELERLTVEVTDQLDLSVGAWLVGVARPRIPRAGILPDIAQTDVRPIAYDAHYQGLDIAPKVPGGGRTSVLEDLVERALSSRRGLRRWTVRASLNSRPDHRSDESYLELHNDGTIALTCRLDWGTATVEGHHVVPAELAESFAADLIALAHASARFRSVDAPMSVRLDIVTPDSSIPLAIVTRYHQGNFPVQDEQQPPWASPVRNFIPLETEISVADDTDSLRDRARELARDVLHQFGHDPLRIIPPRA